MPLNREKIEKNMTNPVTLRLFDTVGSTNDEAKRSAPSDAGLVLYAADRQTAGRGRRGHSFYSPPTGLYMTLSFPAAGKAADLQRLTCAAAVAVCDALTALGVFNPAVKWVNDVYLNGKKAAGILAELVTDDDNQPLRVIVGVGVNLTTAEFPAEFAEKATGAGDLDPSLLCAAIADRLIGWYDRLHDASLIERYKALNLVIGRQITYADRGGVHTAKAVDIAPDGSLIVEENDVEKALFSGEISVNL